MMEKIILITGGGRGIGAACALLAISMSLKQPKSDDGRRN